MRISLYTVILNIFIKYYIHSTFNILMIDSNILNETDARCHAWTKEGPPFYKIFYSNDSRRWKTLLELSN